MTIEEYKALCAASSKKSSTKSLCSTGNNLCAKKNKYGAIKSGGYDSRKEHNRANELKMMQRAGLISGLREQVKFVLIPTQRDADGNLLEKECSYYADFVYTKNGVTVVEDTKGVHTKEYIIKRKLMLLMHGIRIKEV